MDFEFTVIINDNRTTILSDDSDCCSDNYHKPEIKEILGSIEDFLCCSLRNNEEFKKANPDYNFNQFD